MNENVLPNGAALRRAVRWLSEQRSESPGASVAALIEQPSMRFDLSPLETSFLFDQFVRSARPTGCTGSR
jgi:hypothetical protein